MEVDGQGLVVTEAVREYERRALKARRETIATAVLGGMLGDRTRSGSYEEYALDAIRFADALIAELDD